MNYLLFVVFSLFSTQKEVISSSKIEKNLLTILDKEIQKDSIQKNIEEPQAAGSVDEVEIATVSKQEMIRDSLIAFASKFIGTPYRWGGTQPSGFDCSGFALYIFKKFGYNLPRVSGAQVQVGKEVKESEAQAGDLAYYGYKGYYSHTAIVYDTNPKHGVRVIHATLWGVAITALHFDPYSGHKLLNIKRVIE
jgi:cell wall-associated NlpC family hydrolase